jgi:isopentenyl-diphosphate delta-isomerase
MQSIDHQELWQAYDEQGRPIVGKGLTKPQARAGALHGSSHMWLWRNGGQGVELLLQRRKNEKATWPGFLDVSAAGHIDVGEEPIVAGLRETHEEIGLEFTAEDLQLLFVHRCKMLPPNSDIIEAEFQWVYLASANGIADNQIELEQSEVSATEWLNLEAFQQLIAGDTTDTVDKIVPHAPAYFAMLLAAVDRITGNA